MKITKTYEEDGYIVTVYSNGTITKVLKGCISDEDMLQEEEPTESEIAQAEILLTQQQLLINQKNLDETMAQALLLIAGGIQNV